MSECIRRCVDNVDERLKDLPHCWHCNNKYKILTLIKRNIHFLIVHRYVILLIVFSTKTSCLLLRSVTHFFNANRSLKTSSFYHCFLFSNQLTKPLCTFLSDRSLSERRKNINCSGTPLLSVRLKHCNTALKWHCSSWNWNQYVNEYWKYQCYWFRFEPIWTKYLVILQILVITG